MSETPTRRPTVAPPPRPIDTSAFAPPTPALPGASTSPTERDDTRKPDDIATPSTQPTKRSRPPAPARSQKAPPPTSGAPRKRAIAVKIEPDLHDALDSWRRETHRPFVDCVATAHLAHGAEVCKRFSDAADPARASFGLSNMSRPLLTGREVTLWITNEGLKAIDDAARSIPLTRRAYIHELLRVALKDHQPREQPT